MTHVMPTYFNQIAINFDHGKGCWLWDTEGKKYLDALSGIAVCSLGHAHPKITAVIAEQAAKLLHTSNTYLIASQEQLAEKLCQISNMQQVYFGNSGAEANEAAIKLARLYARKKHIAEPIIITLHHSFHGRSMATLSASGTPRIQAGFEPLVKEFLYVNLNDEIELLSTIEQYQERIIAIMLEPIQGDGGIRIASEHYLSLIRKLCDANDWLMILDEIQTGVGRTGKWYAHQHTNILPDIITSAKALGNGIPISATLARGKACNLFGPGKHGSTFGGNPFAMAVGFAVLQTMQEENILANTAQMGTYLLQRLQATLGSHPSVKEIRGQGLMIGVELTEPCLNLPPIAAHEQHLLINVVANSTIRLLPPLIINQTEAEEIVLRLQSILADC